MVLLAFFPAARALGQTLYWDINKNTAGAGGSSPSETWSTSGSDRNWSTSSAGTSGGNQKWSDGNYAVFSAGADATGSYTITVSGTRDVSGITIEDGSPTFTGGTINFEDSSPTFVVNSGRTAIVNSVIAGSDGLTLSGGGTLVFDGSAKTYTGATTVSAGTLRLDSSHLIDDSSALAVASGADVLLNWGVSERVGALSGAGTVDFRTGTFTVGDASSSTFSGLLENTYGTFVKEGSGSLTLTGANTYSGVTNINAGTLVAANDTALGTSTYGNTVASGAALHLQGNISLTEGQFSVTGSGAGGTGAVRSLSGNNTLNATLDLAGNTTVAADAGSTLATTGAVGLSGNILTTAGSGDINLSGAINGSGGVTKTGNGTLTLAGTGANSFAGALNVNDGTVVLAKTAGINAVAGSSINVGDGSGAASSAILRLGGSNQIADYAGTLTVAADGVFQLNNFSEAINRLAGTGVIDLGTSGDLTVGINSGDSIFGGSLLGTGTVTKSGSGLLELATDIAFGGTFNLGGGTLRLSDAVFTVDTFNLTANSTIDFAGTVSQLLVTNLNLNGFSLNIINWSDAVDFFFATNWNGAVQSTRGAAPMNQVTFSGFSPNDTQWQSYDSQVTPVPEASTYGALLLGALTGFFAWRRLVRRPAR